MRYVRYWIRWTLDFPQKLYSVEYLYVYASYENNCVVLRQSTPYSADAPDAEMPYEEVVDTMGYDILDKIE